MRTAVAMTRLPITRRRLLSLLAGGASLAGGVPGATRASAAAIDRRRLVTRHNPVATALDPHAPLSVGNGEIAFTADLTGLQTFADAYETGTPLCTQSQWGWHSFPPLPGLSEADLALEPYDTHGRSVGYATRSEGQQALYTWLRENPHRLNLGRLGLALPGAAEDARPGRVTAARQTLDLWTGLLESRFELDGRPVSTTTACDPEVDAIAVVVRSPLLRDGGLGLAVAFPYGSPQMNASDWGQAGRHQSALLRPSPRRAEVARTLDADRYAVTIAWEGAAELRPEGPHRFVLRAKHGADTLAVVFRFTRAPEPGDPPSAHEVIERSRGHWPRFWTEGAAVDLGESQDGRAAELERRVVLSQYLTAIQCAGSLPPQETGLTCNSWYGKFHLEMHYWHAAQFALWGRLPLLERSLPYYRGILVSSRERARSQGYSGARWPKMVGPEGRDSPSPIGPLLIWQQPHPIVYAELARAAGGDGALERYRDLVFESAEFMASYAVREEASGRYVLGPPVIPAQESHGPRETWNPTYELAYWAHGLEIAQRWRERLSLPREPRWEKVRTGLARLPVRDGVYLAHENAPATFTTGNVDHPSMLAACGVLPGQGVDRETMRATLDRVLAVWKWETSWGWDFPMVAMTAARLGLPERAIDALLLDAPKNVYRRNGHNYQRPNLPLYLPGNGGLLLAVALLAGTGFPSRGWTVRAEGLRPLR
jgi:hypothetical protein